VKLTEESAKFLCSLKIFMTFGALKNREFPTYDSELVYRITSPSYEH